MRCGSLTWVVSSLNHDCAPNLGYYFDSAFAELRVYAVRDVLPGEELTISYVEYVFHTLYLSWSATY